MKWNRTDLDALPVYEKLVKLARKPFDLNAPGALSPDRISKYKTSAAGFDLLYSTQRVDDAAINGLQQLADQSGAVDQFLAMKHGAVMNRIEGYESENRQVLHTACRDIFSDSPCNGEATQQAKQQLENLGFPGPARYGRSNQCRGKNFYRVCQYRHRRLRPWPPCCLPRPFSVCTGKQKGPFYFECGS